MKQFRARSSLIYSSIVMGACAVIGIMVLIGGGWYEARPALGFLAALAALAFAAYFRPSVDVYDDRVVLVNVLTIAEAPFARLSSISTRWALELRADDSSKATAFAAPAPGAMKSRTVTKHRDHVDPDIASIIYEGGPSTSSDTASGAAAHLVDDAYQAWKMADTTPSVSATAQPADASAGLGRQVTQASGAENILSPQTATASGRAITRRPNWLSIAVLVAGLGLFAFSF
ncbi:hypothetical protein [Demequina oxidasica]|uniref:hypothetical protein n=1 Tax=Demequina oxidasica TaxID=676199 RepID=UPI000781ACCB|nr:hypothetical protein [Demequina oxidasica]